LLLLLLLWHHPNQQVRLGIHQLSRRKVAIKIIDKGKLSDPNEAKRIQREIRVLQRLSHDSVIKLFEVLDAGEAAGSTAHSTHRHHIRQHSTAQHSTAQHSMKELAAVLCLLCWWY
jgi:serine/threonine protein kinase